MAASRSKLTVENRASGNRQGNMDDWPLRRVSGGGPCPAGVHFGCVAHALRINMIRVGFGQNGSCMMSLPLLGDFQESPNLLRRFPSLDSSRGNIRRARLPSRKASRTTCLSRRPLSVEPSEGIIWPHHCAASRQCIGAQGWSWQEGKPKASQQLRTTCSSRTLEESDRPVLSPPRAKG